MECNLFYSAFIRIQSQNLLTQFIALQVQVHFSVLLFVVLNLFDQSTSCVTVFSDYFRFQSNISLNSIFCGLLVCSLDTYYVYFVLLRKYISTSGLTQASIKFLRSSYLTSKLIIKYLNSITHLSEDSEFNDIHLLYVLGRHGIEGNEKVDELPREGSEPSQDFRI